MATKLSGVTPTLVIPLGPQYHTIISQAESQKKVYLSMSGSTPIYQYKVKWINITDAKYLTIESKYRECLGGYDSFFFKCMPDYIDCNHDGTADGSGVTVRFVEGSFDESPNAKSWNVDCLFEESI